MAAMPEVSPEPITHRTLPVMLSHEDRRSTYSIREAYRHETIGAMRLCLLVMAGIVLCLLGWTYTIWRTALTRQPLTVGINQETGAAYVLRPESLHFRLTDQVLRHFLMRWTEDHFQRLIVGENDYRKSLLFMSSKLTGGAGRIDADLKEFEQARRGEIGELSVKATNAVVTNLSDVLQRGCTDVDFRATGRLCTALVQFEKTVEGRSKSEVQTVAAVAEVQFVMLSEVPEQFVSTNPLGFVITAFHVSEGRE